MAAVTHTDKRNDRLRKNFEFLDGQHSPPGVMSDQGFDDGEDLLLLVARQSGDGFELAF